jgi:tetratricopeptide (TPR) repeat protein
MKTKSASKFNPAKTEPTSAETNVIIGMFNQGRYAEAEPLVRALLVRFPKYGFCHKALGAVLRQQGRKNEALEAMQKAAEFLPHDAEAHYNLAVIYKEQGQFADAEASYKNVLVRKPDFVAAHNGLGNILRVQGRFDKAITSYRQALKFKPDFVDALDSLIQLLVAQGELVEALNLTIQYLQVSQSSNAKILFTHCATNAKLQKISEAVLRNFTLALSEPWSNPAALIATGVLFVKSDLAIQKSVLQAVKAWPDRLSAQDLFSDSSITAVANNALLIELLVAAPICDVELERFFTSVRKTILDAAISSDQKIVNNAVLKFYGALARQCFINEYVYALTDQEVEQASALKDAMAIALEANDDIPILSLLAVATYFPLHTLPHAERLLQKSWSEPVAAMLEQLVGEPMQEQQYRASFTQLTEIEGEVSLAVQSMYEENPYPRWIKTTPAVQLTTVNDYLRQHFPLVNFHPVYIDGDVEILIAGCGTGRHSIGTARKFVDARVLAIDLSLSSLSYAKRKSQELSLTNVEYAQADIMKLGELNRSFDVIESGGVLHHLGDPLAGWRVLLSLLRPGGVMGIALYSEVARRNIVRARAFIAEQGYASTAQDIRRCRQDVMDLDASMGFSDLLKANDFYSVSDCRDLLFHVQEHRMTLTGIDAFLRENNLVFLGLQVKAEVLAAYKLRFPNDLAATNLNQWQIFENEHPDTFIGMYQFWLQKQK